MPHNSRYHLRVMTTIQTSDRAIAIIVSYSTDLDTSVFLGYPIKLPTLPDVPWLISGGPRDEYQTKCQGNAGPPPHNSKIGKKCFLLQL